METLLALAACVVASSACPVTPPEPTVPIEQLTAVYERSGGLKPMPQKLVLRPGRHATATIVGASGPRTTRFRISVLKAKQLRNGLQTAHLEEIDPGPPGACADCYFYSLAFRGNSVTLSEADVAAAGIGKTIRRFEALVEAHLPFH